MFLLRGRTLASRFFTLAQSTIIETAPKVSAVKLMHTMHFYNGEFSNLNYRFLSTVAIQPPA